jgi:hypothetical protein
MRSHVRKFILGVSLVAVLSMTTPAMATARDGGARHNWKSRLRSFVAHILDVAQGDWSLPPG